MHIGLIGFGSIGRGVRDRLAALDDLSFATLTRRPVADPPDSLIQVHDLEALLETRPALIVECAGHAAVRDHGAAVLRAGIPLIVASLGALAEDVLADSLRDAARTPGARLIFPSGAIGGLDILRAAALSGEVQVRYSGTKPPAAWAGSPADGLIQLDGLTSATTFFSGTARDAARQFPGNANVVAALALAASGFDGVQVDLVADPHAAGNTHHYSVTCPACRFAFTITSVPSPENPRTSLTTVLSIVDEVRRLAETRQQIRGAR